MIADQHKTLTSILYHPQAHWQCNLRCFINNTVIKHTLLKHFMVCSKTGCCYYRLNQSLTMHENIRYTNFRVENVVEIFEIRDFGCQGSSGVAN